MLFADTKALIVTIHQDFLRIPNEHIPNIPQILASLNTNEMGVLGAAVDIMRNKIEKMGPLAASDIDKQRVIDAWDESRKEWIMMRGVENIYDKVLIVVGKQLKDNQYMKETWQMALTYDAIDYISMTQGGDQDIKAEWNVPKQSRKVRIAYTEPPLNLGRGREHFIDTYHAIAWAGHIDSDTVASPFFSFEFIDQWLQKKSFKAAITHAWNAGKQNIRKQNDGFQLARLLGGYENPQQAIDSSLMEYAARNAQMLTIDSHIADLENRDVVEENFRQ
jgi:hypothetical protein